MRAAIYFEGYNDLPLLDVALIMLIDLSAVLFIILCPDIALFDICGVPLMKFIKFIMAADFLLILSKNIVPGGYYE